MDQKEYYKNKLINGFKNSIISIDYFYTKQNLHITINNKICKA